MTIHFIVIPLTLVTLPARPLVQTLPVLQILYIVTDIHATALISVGAFALAVTVRKEPMITVTPSFPVLTPLTMRFPILHLPFKYRLLLILK